MVAGWPCSTLRRILTVSLKKGWFDKRFMYKESFRTPLIVRWPGVVKSGSVNSNLTQNIDLAETFLDIAGAPIPGDMQGKSLVPLLKGKTPENWRDSLYYHYYMDKAHGVTPHYGVRTDRYKLICFYKNNEWEFYDLEKDPNEMNNIYSNPEYADKIAELKKELKRLRKSRLASRGYSETLDFPAYPFSSCESCKFTLVLNQEDTPLSASTSQSTGLLYLPETSLSFLLILPIFLHI